MYCNSVDDLEFHVHDTVGHLSFADTFPSFGKAPNLERVEGEPPFVGSVLFAAREKRWIRMPLASTRRSAGMGKRFIRAPRQCTA